MVNKLKYWPNIPYKPRLLKLSGDTCQQLIGWKIVKLKIIKNKYILLFMLSIIIYNKNSINLKLMFHKFFGPICNRNK
jgi:hypothetical protein